MAVEVPEAYQKRVEVIGWGMHVPERVRGNRELVQMTKYQSVADIVRRCGVRERHIVGAEETCADLATEAGAKALRVAGLRPDEVSYIVVGTTVPDDLTVSTASLVQRNLRARNATVFDVRAACTGFLKSLEVASCLVDSHGASNGRTNVLVIGAEVLSRLFDAEDPNNSILFGDGAGAIVLTRSQRPKPWIFASEDNGDLWDLITRPMYIDRKLIFQGKRVFEEAIRSMVNCTNGALTKGKLSTDDIGLFVPHQANLRIIRAVAKRFNMTDSLGRINRKVFVNIQRYGNTSTASIPIALTEAAESGRMKRGALIAMAGFGAGLSASAAVMEW